MAGAEPEPLGWLSDCSEPALRAVLRDGAPELAGLPISLERTPQSNPIWAAATARIGGRAFAKFALSEETAVRIWREAQVLRVVGDLPVPKLVAAARNPAFSSTELLPGGAPLDYRTVAAAAPDRIARFAEEIARFLARLHDPGTVALAREQVDALPRVPEPELHVSTDELRARFTPLIDPRQRPVVSRWCDWVDDRLRTRAETVFVHGDFHPYNQLWDLDEPRLLAVVDFENSGLGEPELDFRVLPVFGPGVDLLLSTVERYEALAGRTLDLARVMALHLLNYLGDALWRTEAGIELPEPGATPSAYVEEAAGRLEALGIDP